MISVVAIIGMLASDGDHDCSSSSSCARSAPRRMTNLSAIAKLQNGYFGENGTLPDVAAP